MNEERLFGKAVATIRRLQPQRDQAILREYDNAVAAVKELIPKLRAQNWARLVAEKERLEQEKAEAWAGFQAAKQLAAQREKELNLARAEGDPRAGELAAEVEELKGKRKVLYARHGEALKKLAGLSVTQVFSGTLGELREALLRPDFLVDRNVIEAWLTGPWRWVDESQEVVIKFSLETGELVEPPPPPRPTRFPWNIWH